MTAIENKFKVGQEVWFYDYNLKLQRGAINSFIENNNAYIDFTSPSYIWCAYPNPISLNKLFLTKEEALNAKP